MCGILPPDPALFRGSADEYMLCPFIRSYPVTAYV